MISLDNLIKIKNNSLSVNKYTRYIIIFYCMIRLKQTACSKCSYGHCVIAKYKYIT